MSRSFLNLTVLTACLALSGGGCGDDASPGGKKGTGAKAGASGAGTAGTGAGAGVGGSAGSAAGGPSSGGLAGASAGSSAAGTSGTAGELGTAGMGGQCTISGLSVFSRSDTDQPWDDNDFGTEGVVTTAGCPYLFDVTWPHEADWEELDPSEANSESVHFTLDSAPPSNDLSGKQLNLTIELSKDEQAPNATVGAYIVQLVSVSTYDRIVVVGGAGAGAGGDAGGAGMSGGGASGGLGGVGGIAGAAAGQGGRGGRGGAGAGGAGAAGAAGAVVAGAGGVAGIGGIGGIAGSEVAGAGGVMTTTERGYAEAVSPDSENRTLYRVGDRANLTFKIPAKTDAEDSYNPTTVIKINVRVHTLYATPDDGSAGASGAGGEAGSEAASPPGPLYGYLTSQFTISNFTVTDVAP